MGLMLPFAPTVYRTVDAAVVSKAAVADYPTAGVVMPLAVGFEE